MDRRGITPIQILVCEFKQNKKIWGSREMEWKYTEVVYELEKRMVWMGKRPSGWVYVTRYGEEYGLQ